MTREQTNKIYFDEEAVGIAKSYLEVVISTAHSEKRSPSSY